jgi:hypothetical protein
MRFKIDKENSNRAYYEADSMNAITKYQLNNGTWSCTCFVWQPGYCK